MALKRKYIEYVLRGVYADFDSFLTDEQKEEFYSLYKIFKRYMEKKACVIDMEYCIEIMIMFMREKALVVLELDNNHNR